MSVSVSMPLFKSREEYEQYKANQITGGSIFGGAKKGKKGNAVNPEDLSVSSGALAPTVNATETTTAPATSTPDYNAMTKEQLTELGKAKGIKPEQEYVFVK